MYVHIYNHEAQSAQFNSNLHLKRSKLMPTISVQNHLFKELIRKRSVIESFKQWHTLIYNKCNWKSTSYCGTKAIVSER